MRQTICILAVVIGGRAEPSMATSICTHSPRILELGLELSKIDFDQLPSSYKSEIINRLRLCAKGCGEKVASELKDSLKTVAQVQDGRKSFEGHTQLQGHLFQSLSRNVQSRIIQGRKDLDSLIHHREQVVPQLSQTDTPLKKPKLLNADFQAADAGSFNHGIFEVQTEKHGKAVFKLAVTEDRTREQVQESLMIQKVLGDLGYAPQLHEVKVGEVLERHVRAINSSGPARRIPAPNPADPRIGILMEKIEGAWNFPKSSSEPLPDFARKWTSQQLSSAVHRIRELEISVNKMGIYADDIQFFIPPNGHIVLGDLDAYRLARPGDKPNDFTPHIEGLIRKWERDTGQKIPDWERTFGIREPRAPLRKSTHH